MKPASPASFFKITKRSAWLTCSLFPGLMVFSVAYSETANHYKIFRYQDESGVVVFTDQNGNLPDGAESMEWPSGAAAPTSSPQRGQPVKIKKRGERKIITTPVIIRNNSIYIPVELRHYSRKVKAHLILDTGAAMTVLHRNLANKLALVPKQRYKNVLSDGQGRQKQTELVSANLQRLRLGDLEWKDAIIWYHTERDYLGPPWSEDGLLGMDVLKHVDFRIDYDQSKIHWILRKNNVFGRK